MTDRTPPTPARRPARIGLLSIVTGLGLAVLGVAVGILVVSGWQNAGNPDGTDLLSYGFALVLCVPLLLALVCWVVALATRRRAPGVSLGFAIAAAVIAGLSGLWAIGFFVR